MKRVISNTRPCSRPGRAFRPAITRSCTITDCQFPAHYLPSPSSTNAAWTKRLICSDALSNWRKFFARCPASALPNVSAMSLTSSMIMPIRVHSWAISSAVSSSMAGTKPWPGRQVHIQLLTRIAHSIRLHREGEHCCPCESRLNRTAACPDRRNRRGSGWWERHGVAPQMETTHDQAYRPSAHPAVHRLAA